jgi:hypothetical protein
MLKMLVFNLYSFMVYLITLPITQDTTALNDRMINELKRTRPNLRYNHSIFPPCLRKTIKNLSQDSQALVPVLNADLPSMKQEDIQYVKNEAVINFIKHF